VSFRLVVSSSYMVVRFANRDGSNSSSEASFNFPECENYGMGDLSMVSKSLVTLALRTVSTRK
jgi:hypothetical protein